MPIPLDDDLHDLASSVAGTAARHAPVTDTRERLDELTAGALPPVWSQLADSGLLAMHLPEQVGGGAAGLEALVAVAEVSGKSMLPGPWLPSVVASSVVASADATHPVLEELAGGAPGALVRGGLTASRDGADWVVTGESHPALGLTGAAHAVVAALSEDGSDVWFVLSGSELADRVQSADPVDLTRSVGRLRADGLRVTDLLADVPSAFVDLVVAATFAAEAAGLAAWAVETAVDHVSSRVQFGKPIGSFQAVQHKTAMMLLRKEIAAAAAWDAARAEAHDEAQQQLAAAQAVLNAVVPAVDVLVELVSLLGGIGFTWEHDAHLYWRRAMSLSGLVGTTDEWAARLGEVALEHERDFAFLAGDAQPELRAEIGPVLDRVAELSVGADRSTWARVRPGPTTDLLFEAKLVAPHYPAPYGRGAGPEEQAVIVDEFAKRGLQQPGTVIGEWVLPTLLVHGTEAQQQRFVDPTLRGEIIWCQLFSEPGAGSDLASLTTRAVKVDGGWRLQGQKVWTSGAHESQWGVCLARTDADAPKHKGISYFLVDMASDGIDVRPLKQSTGRAEFNEVFLDDVFVPDECLVGEREQGWKLAVTTLSNERLSMGSRLTHGGAHELRGVIVDGRQLGRRDDAVRAYGRCVAREIALSSMNLRSVLARLSGLELGAGISVQKLYNSLAQRDGAADLISVLGPVAATTEGGHAIDHLGLPAVLFGGGTVEIQLNVIAQRVLGLPRQS